LNGESLNAYNLFLIGYRCTGKSSVGKALAAKLGWQFLDTDSLLVSESGISIKEIVETHGWQTFRKLEHVIVEQVCTLDRQIVATGGGVVLSTANVQLMKQSGRLVWLRATPETIRRRMIQDADTETLRPALTSKDSIAEIEETLLERESYYRQAMDFYVQTDRLGLNAIAGSIIEYLKREK